LEGVFKDEKGFGFFEGNRKILTGFLFFFTRAAAIFIKEIQ
jgi:hypothetical protein